MSHLLFQNINKIYSNHVQAVFDFNLEINDKEFIVFVGPSGCGKSTTLRMVAGLEDISSGELYIDNNLVNVVEPKDRDIAMVFQSYALYPHMTVYNNMAFGLKLRKIPCHLYEEESEEAKEIKIQIKELAKSIKKVVHSFKKKQGDDELLERRNNLYKELYDLYDKYRSLLVPVKGIDNYNIEKYKSQLAKVTKELNKLENLSTKPNLNDESINFLNGEIERKNKNIQDLQAKIDYLLTNEVELKKARHLSKLEIDLEINKAAETIDLVRYLYRKPSALSGGQRQRVALGRAIVRRPKVFLMDEPLSNLDAKLRVQTRSEIIKIHEKVGATTIYVTHDQTEAMTMADRIVIMKDGYIQQVGEPDTVYQDPDNKFVAGFIGSPSMNLFNGKFVKDSFVFDADDSTKLILKLNDKDAKMLKSYNDKNIILGARPEALYVEGDKTNSNPSKPFKLLCDFSESLGFEYLVHSFVGGQKIVIKTNLEHKVCSKEEFKLCFNLDKLYFFDPETEKRIR